MKAVFTIFLLFVNIVFSFAQHRDSIKQPLRIRNIFWTTPVTRNTEINGLALGASALPWNDADSLRINGINIEATPLTAFGAVYALVGTVAAPFGKKDSKETWDDIGNRNFFTDTLSVHETSIEGLSIGTGIVRGCELRGVAVNGLIGFSDQTNGLEITGIMNLHYSFKGISIAGLRNKTTHGKGFQIAPFNTAKEGQLIQLGLINRIGNRILPIMNFSLRRHRQGS